MTESIFITLFDCQSEIDKVKVLAGNPIIVGDTNRREAKKLLETNGKALLVDKKVQLALYRMSKLLQVNGIKFSTITPTEAFESLPQTTGSSFPRYVRKKAQIRTEIISQLHYLLRKPKPVFQKYLIGINWRTQVSRSSRLKYRQFYPFPVLVAALEKVLFGKFFTHFEKTKNTPYCYGNIFPDLAKRYDKWQNFSSIYSLDLKSFDQNIVNSVLQICLDFLAKHTSMSANEQILFSYLKAYHLNCNIVTSIGGKTTVFQKRQGLMSGSALTNLLGTLVNLFYILYADEELNLKIDTRSLSIMSDDIVFATNVGVRLQTLNTYYKDKFNQTLQIEKSEIFKPGERVYFLGHFFDSKGRYLNVDRLTLNLCFSEHYIPESVMNTYDRIWSKFCSLLFKCSDGKDYFDKYKDKLMRILGTKQMPKHYVNFWDTSGSASLLSFEEFKQNGWMKQ